jgi:hypothetical protein
VEAITLHYLFRWIWRDHRRRALKLLDFAEIEADGGRDLARAAERTADPVLRRLYLRHAADEQHHAVLFRDRGSALLNTLSDNTLADRRRDSFRATALTPGERGLDDLRVQDESDENLLAFLHLSEKAAATRLAQYRDAVPGDPCTAAVFNEILKDETFHMNYTAAQLSRISPHHQRRALWRARMGRLWKAYLRFAVALAGVIAGAVLALEYFLLLPPFALMARWSARKERSGWVTTAARPDRSLKNEY